ncbi:LysR substrate-binding domain-containing protein [Pararhizobium antarcticum]|uniref:HTH-type transcriptional regulator TtuA n=1 Tax=Pararhizobium antarcticum TaxID=1798805 RepID=A0A657LK66_9HYPH|nr:LysR family transcriptional regulator [Pararhizobium antarcticum]OJF90094.1 transcriptional regulator [Pararhizobium antarcticum]OJF90623.1 transcriptional regulator [Rhizobium sp. 58]
MQFRRRISLNAIRVFATVARTGSLTAAGAELGVTAGAVSHQLKKLEDGLGVSFFRRGNNSVSLTDVGERFYQEVSLAIGLIERSADALYRDENEMTVLASMSFAVRWLIPSLERFRTLCPQARVRVETSTHLTFPTVSIADVTIRYVRADEPVEGWALLCRDLSCPVVSPSLLARDGDLPESTISDVPALQCAAGNWDWKLWCAKSGVPMKHLTFAHEFDTDDAALHACVAGLGMVLAPHLLTSREIRSGTLTALPGYKPVEIGSYRYLRRSESRLVRQFCAWMEAEMRGVE